MVSNVTLDRRQFLRGLSATSALSTVGASIVPAAHLEKSHGGVRLWNIHDMTKGET